jgi:uncharacterized protein
MSDLPAGSCSAFCGTRRIACGDVRHVALKAKEVLDRDRWAQVLIFDDLTSEPVEVDLRGSAEEILERIESRAPRAGGAGEPSDLQAEPRRPGRPKLGVVAREVTLLPRHWDWLAAQPGGASVALRKLVEQARLANQGRDRLRRAQEAAYRFLSAMAGNEADYEEAIRALFAGREDRFDEIVEPWPPDIRDHARKLAAAAFASS